MPEAPPLSVIIPVRDGAAEAEAALEALVPQAESLGAEVVVVGGPAAPAPSPSPNVRVIAEDDRDLLRLRLRAIRESRGEIVAIGEDHAVPRPDWCEAILRAHREHPEAPVIAGALVNATDRTLAGRANFMAFASPWQPPLATLHPKRPPPVSALSFKRDALAGLEATGELEAGLVVRLHASRQMVGDGRIVIDHFQDHGLRWSLANGFHAARSSYGYARSWMPGRDRRRAALAVVPNIMVGFVREAWQGRRAQGGSLADVVAVVPIAFATGLGGAVGALLGPGRSPEEIA